MSDFNEKLERCLLKLEKDAENFYNAWIFEKRKKWITRRWYRRPIYQKKLELGYFATMFQELKEDPDLFFKYTRMDLATFELLLNLVKPKIIILKRKKHAAQEEERLAITLRYLASGDEIFSIALDYRISESTVRTIIKETCLAIHEALAPVYLRTPSRPVWRNIAKGFWEDWQFPNCCGAVDGTHVTVVSPSNSATLFFNYKKYFSLHVLAACNHRYEFTMVEVGNYGSDGDAGILNRSKIGNVVYDGNTLPPKERIPNSNIELPYCFVGDDAFTLTENIMKPYANKFLSRKQRIFNYRLSRARRCIENAFGILFNRWKVFSKAIGFEAEHVDHIVLACICLHNFLMFKTQRSVRRKYCEEYFNTVQDGFSIENDAVQEDVSIENDAVQEDVSNLAAKRMRDTLANYFVGAGKVDWQDDFIDRGRLTERQTE